VAREILQEIRNRTGLTASAGVSYNKFLAKVASDVNKPAGLTVVTPEQAEDFIAELPIRRFHGVGRVTEKRMLARGIATGADLRRCSLEELQKLFGNSGPYFYDIARGIDNRAVMPNRVRKSIGKETTLEEDCADKGEMMIVLGKLSEWVAALVQAHNTSGLTLTLKIRYDDFQSVTRSHTQIEPINDAETMMLLAETLLDKTEAGPRPVRLLGLTVSNLTTDIPLEESAQMELPFP
jgi:DNA polymerase-4